jgi:hypothetical protein
METGNQSVTTKEVRVYLSSVRTLLAPDVPASLLVDVEVVDSSVVDGDDDDDDDGDEVDDEDPCSGATTASGLAEDINLYYS